VAGVMPSGYVNLEEFTDGLTTQDFVNTLEIPLTFENETIEELIGSYVSKQLLPKKFMHIVNKNRRSGAWQHNQNGGDGGRDGGRNGMKSSHNHRDNSGVKKRGSVDTDPLENSDQQAPKKAKLDEKMRHGNDEEVRVDMEKIFRLVAEYL
jgi:hypothetical protein